MQNQCHLFSKNCEQKLHGMVLRPWLVGWLRFWFVDYRVCLPLQKPGDIGVVKLFFCLAKIANLYFAQAFWVSSQDWLSGAFIFLYNSPGMSEMQNQPCVSETILKEALA